MKPTNRYLAVLVVLLVLSSGCATSGGGTSPQDSSASNKVAVNDPGMDLTGLLKQISGISVAGNGSNAIITMRTTSSYSTGLATDYINKSPLFVIDGEIIGNDYARAYQKVNMQNVASINVLKRTDALLYGSRGSGGVIEINYM